MDNREKAQLLIRLARKNPDERDALLVWTEELLSSNPQRALVQTVQSNGRLQFPVAIFRVFKHRNNDALLLEGWRVEMDGRTFSSPSAAAVAISGNSVNGWRFWNYKNPQGRTRIIDDLRQPSKAS